MLTFIKAVPEVFFAVLDKMAAVTVIWVSCFGYPHPQIPSEMGIPGRDTQNTDSYTDERLEEARWFCRLSPLFKDGGPYC